MRGKLLFFLGSLSSGGAERVTTTLANHWVAKGWDVAVVTIAGEEKDFYRLDPATRRIALDIAADSRTVAQSVLHNLRRIRALHGILKRESPDIAVAMMPTANVILALAGRLAGVPSIGSERAHPPAIPLGRLWESARRRSYPLLCGLVAQTEDSAAWLRVHAPATRIAVIPNPVEYPLPVQPPRVAPESVRARLRGDRLLLAVGRLENQKGFDRLLNAFADLSRRHADWSLVILGEGGLRGALTAQATGLGLDGRFAFPGVVGNVGDWFEVADVYALTSRFEGFPNTLLEAMAHGVPPVAVDCMTGPRELIENEVNGLLVPQDDPSSLIAAFDRLMGDAGLRARLATVAVEVREAFAVARIAEQWERMFRTVVRKADA